MIRRQFATGTTIPPGKSVGNNNSASGTTLYGRRSKQAPVASKRGDTTSNCDEKSTQQQQANKQQQTPRRLVVKRNTSAEEAKKPTTKDVGVIIQKRRRRKKPKTEIRDTWGQLILTVPRKINTTTKSEQQDPSNRLPILNASALLHTKDYCVHSADSRTSTSGLGAARRLIQGKHDFLKVLRQLVHDTQQRFVLQGHGVPHQLLQEHVELANALLTHHENANSCAFHYHPRQSGPPTASNDDDDTNKNCLERWMRILQHDGSHRVVKWPPIASNNNNMLQWQESMQLYVTVMHRLATKLGTAVLIQSETATTKEHQKDKDDLDENVVDDYDNEFHAATHQDDAAPHHWNVEFARAPNTHFNVPEPLKLTVAWMPIPKGPSAPGHVRLQLQGSPRQGGAAVRLSLDACFRYEQRKE